MLHESIKKKKKTSETYKPPKQKHLLFIMHFPLTTIDCTVQGLNYSGADGLSEEEVFTRLPIQSTSGITLSYSYLSVYNVNIIYI